MLLLGWKQHTLAQCSGVSVGTVRCIEQSGHGTLQSQQPTHQAGWQTRLEPLMRYNSAQTNRNLDTSLWIVNH